MNHAEYLRAQEKILWLWHTAADPQAFSWSSSLGVNVFLYLSKQGSQPTVNYWMLQTLICYTKDVQTIAQFLSGLWVNPNSGTGRNSLYSL